MNTDPTPTRDEIQAAIVADLRNWRACSAQGRFWTIEELFVRWRANWRRSLAQYFGVDRVVALSRVIAAIEAGEHRTHNGEIPARIYDWFDAVAVKDRGAVPARLTLTITAAECGRSTP